MARESQANRVLRSASAVRKRQGEGDRKRRLEDFLKDQSAKFAAQRFRDRVETQKAISKRLPRGSVGEALLRKNAGEACSACRSRRKASPPAAHSYAPRRFSPGALLLESRRSVRPKKGCGQTNVKSKAKPKAVPEPEIEEESSEEEDDGDGSGVDWDPPKSPEAAQTPREQQLQQQLQQTNMQQLNSRLVNQEAQLLQLQAASPVGAGLTRLSQMCQGQASHLGKEWALWIPGNLERLN